jgi:hypothetical protein
MELDKLGYTDTRSALNAADEALQLIPLDSLSDTELGEFFFNSLEDEIGVAKVMSVGGSKDCLFPVDMTGGRNGRQVFLRTVFRRRPLTAYYLGVSWSGLAQVIENIVRLSRLDRLGRLGLKFRPQRPLPDA